MKLQIPGWIGFLFAAYLFSSIVWAEPVPPKPESPSTHDARSVFCVTVVDDQTGRGVPLVELKTDSNIRYVTDSAGVAVIDDPALIGRRVFFQISSHGYEFPANGFGIRGTALDLKPGDETILKIKRLNIAERLYRVTGEGIYRDSVLAGKPTPIEQPLINAEVVGQDSVQDILYRDKIYWFWGDTARQAYPLGHFGTAGATSDLPNKGGLDPSVGVNLHYFTGPDGFSRPTCTFQKEGMVWIDGLMTLKDPEERERLVAHYSIMKSLGERLEHGLITFNDQTLSFDRWLVFPQDHPLFPIGHPFRHTTNGIDYFYFVNPYSLVRVRADWNAIQDPHQYEGFTCLKKGARYSKDNPDLDRDENGKLSWGYKLDTEPVNETQQQELISGKHIKPDEAWYQLKDVESKQSVMLHAGSMWYSPFRKHWCLIAVQAWGTPSFLGEVWYTEANSPEGPWTSARKIVTHDRYSFYNPRHHPLFDSSDGRIVYFEGTYATTFSREGDPTPRYEYNQIMYRLDLADPRLNFPDNDHFGE